MLAKVLLAGGCFGLAVLGASAVEEWQTKVRQEELHRAEKQSRSTLAACMAGKASKAAKRVIAERYWGAWTEDSGRRLGLGPAQPPYALDVETTQAMNALRELCGMPPNYDTHSGPTAILLDQARSVPLTRDGMWQLALEMKETDSELRLLVENQRALTQEARERRKKQRVANEQSAAATRASEARWATNE